LFFLFSTTNYRQWPAGSAYCRTTNKTYRFLDRRPPTDFFYVTTQVAYNNITYECYTHVTMYTRAYRGSLHGKVLDVIIRYACNNNVVGGVQCTLRKLPIRRVYIICWPSVLYCFHIRICVMEMHFTDFIHIRRSPLSIAYGRMYNVYRVIFFNLVFVTCIFKI